MEMRPAFKRPPADRELTSRRSRRSLAPAYSTACDERESVVTRGSWLCGTLRYEIDAPFQMMMHCHCSMCRKHHGAPFATFALGPLPAFRWLSGEDAVATYRSSEQGSRSYCRQCAS